MQNQQAEKYLDKPILTLLSDEVTYLYFNTKFGWSLTNLNDLKSYKNPEINEVLIGKLIERGLPFWEETSLNLMYLSLSSAILNHSKALYENWQNTLDLKQIEGYLLNVFKYQFDVLPKTDSSTLKPLNEIILKVENPGLIGNHMIVATHATGYGQGAEALYVNMLNPMEYLLSTYTLKQYEFGFMRERVYFKIDLSHYTSYCKVDPMFINSLRTLAVQYAHLCVAYNNTTSFNFILNSEEIRTINKRTCDFLGLV